MDFGFYYPPDGVVAFWLALQNDPSKTVTGNWLTEDRHWWLDVWEFDALIDEETVAVKRELKQSSQGRKWLRQALGKDVLDGGEFH